MIWNETIECMSRENMRKLQSERLVDLVNRVYHNVPYYRKKMQDIGLTPSDIISIDDLHKLPFTTKQDLRDNYPFGLFAVPMSEIVRIHASSGTTGKQTVVGYNRRDLAIWSEVIARCLNMAGVSNNDNIQIAYGYGMFTGGLGVHYGAEHVGCSVIPISGGNTARQLQIMHDFGATVLACTPSYALFLAESLPEFGYKLEEMKVRVGIFGAEPWSENMRKELEQKWNIKAMDIYGLSEIMGPGVAADCLEQSGLHVHEDHFVPEIINPDTLLPESEGVPGELVFTTLTKEGLPLIRYRTRDITSLDYSTCACGRTLVRMQKCSGRTDDMLIIRGVNLFPSQIEHVLLNLKETSAHYILIVDRINNLDTLELQVEVEESYFSDRIKELQALTHRIQHALQTTIGLSIKVTLVEPQTIARSEGKAKRVIDKRPKQ